MGVISNNASDKLAMIDQYIKMVTNSPETPQLSEILGTITSIIQGRVVLKPVTTYTVELVDPSTPVAREPGWAESIPGAQ
jgi:hypothetical protein